MIILRIILTPIVILILLEIFCRVICQFSFLGMLLDLFKSEPNESIKRRMDNANGLGELAIVASTWALKKKQLRISAYKEIDGIKEKIQSSLKIIIRDSQSGKIIEKNDNYTNESLINLPNSIQFYYVEAEWCKQERIKEASFLDTDLEFIFTDWVGIKNKRKKEREKMLRFAMRFPYVLRCTNEFCVEPCMEYMVNSPTVKMARKGNLFCEKCGSKIEIIKDGEE